MTRARAGPQLAMCKGTLAGLAPVALPEGCAVRCFRQGDEGRWNVIIAESFGEGCDFEERIRCKPAFLPERVLFAAWGRELVATASAFRAGAPGREHGYLHMVGVLPAHQGKGLGRGISLAALHRMAAEGLPYAVLQTDDFRLAAIRTYLRLGFEPVLVHENQRLRWPAVFAAIGRAEELGRRFAPILSGPVVTP